jgi:hypothetical protein
MAGKEYLEACLRRQAEAEKQAGPWIYLDPTNDKVIVRSATYV